MTLNVTVPPPVVTDTVTTVTERDPKNNLVKETRTRHVPVTGANAP